MEKLKEFLKSPKKTAMLGLVGSILMLFSLIVYFTPYFILDIFYKLGLIIYFVIISIRMFKQKGNLKTANYTLIASYIVQLLLVIPNIKNIFTFKGIIYVVSLSIILLYFFNILLRKKNFVNNKIFAIVIILYTLIQLISVILTIRYSSLVETIIYAIRYIGYLLIIPYFYNYYNILEEENKNGN